MAEDFIQRVKEAEQEIVKFYRHFHENPELSGQERETQKWIMELLTEWGVECRSSADTGVYAVIRSIRPGHTIAFRADMDALPVTEQTGLPYQSKNPGVMHACGHDAHMAILLGGIRILNQCRDTLPGNIVFLFQPSEERDGGAKRMVEDGVMKNPRPELIAAFHVWPQKTHSITCMPGPVMAQPDAFRIEVRGKGGHGASPHLCRNPIPVLALLTLAVNGMATEIIPARESAVVNICRISCGENYNLVVDSGFLEGTIRTYDTDVRDRIIKRLKLLADSVPKAHGTEGSFSMSCGYPSTVNDKEAAVFAGRVLGGNIPGTKILLEGEPSMLGEDFSYFGQAAPALFLRLGCKKEGEEQYPLHHGSFCPDESVLRDGTAALCLLAAAFTKEGYGKNENN